MFISSTIFFVKIFKCAFLWSYLSEEERFELSKDIATFGHLANAWFQPLTHSSIPKKCFVLITSSVRKSCRYQVSRSYNMAYFIFLILIIFSYSSSTDVAIALPFGVNFLFKYLLSRVWASHPLFHSSTLPLFHSSTLPLFHSIRI